MRRGADDEILNAGELTADDVAMQRVAFRDRFGHLFRPRGFAGPSKSQRDVMREIFGRYWPDRDKVIREYAAAEQRGEATRSRNRYNLSPEQYATRLLEDGLKKGWLRGK